MLVMKEGLNSLPVPNKRGTAKFISKIEQLNIDPNTILNLNFPNDSGSGRSASPYKNHKFTSQGIRHYRDVIIAKKDPRGKPYYWIGGRPKWKMMAGTDFSAVKEGLVSITPLKLDFTDQNSLEKFRQNNLKI